MSMEENCSSTFKEKEYLKNLELGQYRLSIHLVNLYIHNIIHLSIDLFICPLVYQFVSYYLSILLSIHPFT